MCLNSGLFLIYLSIIGQLNWYDLSENLLFIAQTVICSKYQPNSLFVLTYVTYMSNCGHTQTVYNGRYLKSVLFWRFDMIKFSNRSLIDGSSSPDVIFHILSKYCMEVFLALEFKSHFSIIQVWIPNLTNQDINRC